MKHWLGRWIPSFRSGTSQPPAAGGPSVIGIGLSKTGTKTLGACFERLGYRNRATYSLEQTIRFVQGDLASVLESAGRYEALEDSPWFAIYEHLATRYPNAKFVLTTRQSGAAWLGSAFNHGNRSTAAEYEQGKAFFEAFLPGVLPKDIHDTHRDRVRAYFATQPQRLLEVCWEREPTWDALCRFLGQPVPQEPFPHENKGEYAA